MDQKKINQICGELDRLNELGKIKANLRELASVLLGDKVISNEEVAFDLLTNIESLNKIEGDMNKAHLNNGFRMLAEYCDSISTNK
ncbi:hypothetical protein ACE38V_12765 [Cytobacillus sp. Hz8]|uniref:hypothetical protein n=1 Tax=Cytobacillus sp. Hz8 TaxID=3347168 RepID=UPI0035D77247